MSQLCQKTSLYNILQACIFVQQIRYIILLVQSYFQMSKPANWNQMSSSEDQDSWFDDDTDVKPKQESKDNNGHQATSTGQHQSNNNTTNNSTTSNKQHDNPQDNREERQGNKRNQQNKRPQRQHANKFLSEAELLKKYADKQVDDPHVIKVVKCFNQEHIEILKKLNLKRMRQGTIEGMFILEFYTTEDLTKFMQEKMANRYKFYFQMFFKGKPRQDRQKKGERNEKYERRGPRQQRKQYEKPRQRYNGQQRKQYQKPRQRYNDKQENRQKYNGNKQDRNRQKRIKQQQKGKKVYVAKENFEISNNSNILTIKNDKFQIQRVCQQLQAKNIFKHFGKLKIKTPFNIFSKVSELIYKIGNQYKWFLQEQPKSEAQPEAIFDLVLNQKLTVDKTNRFYEKYHPKEKSTTYMPSSKAKIQKVEQKVQEKTQSKTKSRYRTLGTNPKQYFDNLSKSNVSELIKGFDENEYIKQLKQNHNQIFQSKWKSWKIQAQDDQIEYLLKLQHRLKKSNLYEIDLKPSMRNDKPILTIQMRIRPEKERRPNFDVSGINDFLS